jgi:mono/diheme cytochrome c family protein
VRRFFRIVLMGLAACLAIVVAAVVVVHLLGERILDRSYTIAAHAPALSEDAASLAHGERLARICGCPGCHGKELEGAIFGEHPLLGRLVAPNLTRLARQYSTVDLVRSIRHGVKPDGRSVVLMPSSMFAALSDEDLAAIIAYVRSRPLVDNSYPDTWIGLVPRWMMARGKWQTEAAQIDHDAAHLASAKTLEGVERGTYLAAIACPECHGLDLEGRPGEAPPLSVIAGYTVEDFRRLMRTGVPIGGRKLDLMAEVAVERFTQFTDEEIDALYAYLRSRVTT